MAGKVTRDLSNMIKEYKNENLYNNIKSDNAFKDFSDGKLLKDIEKAENNLINAYTATKTKRYEIMDFLTNDPIGQTVVLAHDVVKQTAKIATKITPGRFDNLLAKLWDDFDEKIKNDYEDTKKEYDESKDVLWDLMIRGMEDLESLGQLVRDDTLYYHVGTIQNDKLRIFEIDSESMHQLEKDRKLFDLKIDEYVDAEGELQHSISLESRYGTKYDMINELEKIVKKEGNSSELILTDEDQELWSTIASSTELYSTKNEKFEQQALKYGRRFEVFDWMFSGNEDESFLIDITSEDYVDGGYMGYYLDNVSWTAQGDVSYGDMTYQDKFITGSGKFGISSLTTIKEGLSFYTDNFENASYNDFLTAFWEPINEIRDEYDPDVQEDNIDEDINNQSSDQIYDLVDSELS